MVCPRLYLRWWYQYWYGHTGIFVVVGSASRAPSGHLGLTRVVVVVVVLLLADVPMVGVQVLMGWVGETLSAHGVDTGEAVEGPGRLHVQQASLCIRDTTQSCASCSQPRLVL